MTDNMKGVIEMKKIAKIGASILALAAMAFAMTACGSKECDVCGKKFSSGGRSATIDGETIYICPDCNDF